MRAIVFYQHGGPEVLTFREDVPVPQPEPREPFPQLPTILAQRLANHSGVKPHSALIRNLHQRPLGLPMWNAWRK
jgi:hypothetical protein